MPAGCAIKQKTAKQCHARHGRREAIWGKSQGNGQAVKGLSKEGRRVDALALGADERRDKLRKAAGRGRYPLIRRCLNGGTHMSRPHVSVHESIVCGGGPGELKHLSSRRKRKQK